MRRPWLCALVVIVGVSCTRAGPPASEGSVSAVQVARVDLIEAGNPRGDQPITTLVRANQTLSGSGGLVGRPLHVSTNQGGDRDPCQAPLRPQ